MLRSGCDKNGKNRWRLDLGDEAERQAVRYLEQKGFSVQVLKWRAGRLGEIDVIALDPHGTLVFIEVKARQLPLNPLPGFQCAGFERIDRKKKRRMLACASAFLAQTSLRGWSGLRFDVIVVYYRSAKPISTIADLPDPQIIHVPSAIGGF